MLKSELLKKSIADNSAKLALINNEMTGLTLSDCIKEYIEQLEEGSYMTFLRSWLGCMIEQKCSEAVSIMKDIIKYGMAVREERKAHEQ